MAFTNSTSSSINLSPALPSKPQELSADIPQSNGQPKPFEDASLDKNKSKKELTDAQATIRAAWISAVGAIVAGVLVWAATQSYQDNDGRQQALNDYTTSMKELIASTDIERKDSDAIVQTPNTAQTQNTAQTPNTAQTQVIALQYAKTLLVMRELDGDDDRKGQALRFLYETCLVTRRDKEEVSPQCTKANKTILAERKIGFRGVDLNGIDLEDAWIPYVDLSEAQIKGANLQEANLKGADLTKADITPEKLGFWQNLRTLPPINWIFPIDPKANLQGVDLSEANLQGAKLEEADLSRADLSRADLSRANLRGTNLSNATLTDADLTNAIYDAKTKLPSSITDQQQAAMIFIGHGAKLNGRDLSNQNLNEADLSRSDLRSADLRGANLMDADLTGTNLTGACYVEGTEAEYFPPNFNPQEYNMVAISEEQSDPSRSNNFKPCPRVSTP